LKVIHNNLLNDFSTKDLKQCLSRQHFFLEEFKGLIYYRKLYKIWKKPFIWYEKKRWNVRHVMGKVKKKVNLGLLKAILYVLNGVPHSCLDPLQPLQVHESPWPSLYMDFIKDLPCFKSCDSIFVVVNWLTKMVHFIITTKIMTNEGIKLFFSITYKSTMAYNYTLFELWISIHVHILEKTIQNFRGPS